MKDPVSKKEARLENKKKKISALADIIKLNDSERVDGKNLNKEMLEKDTIPPLSNVTVHRKRVHSTDDSETVKKPKDAKVDLANEDQNNSTSTISDEQYVNLKREIGERKRSIRVPKLHLKEVGEMSSLDVLPDNRTPIFFTDIQHLIMTALLGESSPCTPSRWCSLEKASKLSHNIILLIEGISLHDFSSHESKFVELKKIFPSKLEVILPPSNDNILEELATVPLLNTERHNLISKFGSLEAAIESTHDRTLLVKTIFPIDSIENNENAFLNDQEFPRTKLLLSALQMVDENYPLPLRGELANRYKNYVLTKDNYKLVTDKSPMFGLDCEMCRTTLGINELTRISIVDESLKCVYETFVRPTNKIVDYLTKFSGITAEMMLNVTKQLEEVQNDIRKLLPEDAILVGQSLNADLHAMRMMHPYVIDTSIIFNITGDRKRKTKLQTLAQQFLGLSIQKNAQGHDSIEDSQTSLRLTKLKLSKGIYFGDAVLEGKKRYTDQKLQKEILARNIFDVAEQKDKTCCIVTLQNSKCHINLRNITKYDENEDKEKQHTTKVKIVEKSTTKEIFQNIIDSYQTYSLTVGNIPLSSKQLELSEVDNTIFEVDKMIRQVWETFEHNGLITVIFTDGTKKTTNSTSGVALLAVKNPNSVTDLKT